MADEQPPQPNGSSDSGSSTEVSALISKHELSSDRRMEIDLHPKLKLHFQDWGEQLKEDLLKIETYRNRCIAAKEELYRLMSFYILFQGVVFGALSYGSKLTCQTSLFPASLSFLTSVATAVSVDSKLGYYKIEKLKFIKAGKGLAKIDMQPETSKTFMQPILQSRWHSLLQRDQADRHSQFQYKIEDQRRVGGYPLGRGKTPKELPVQDKNGDLPKVGSYPPRRGKEPRRAQFCVRAGASILTFRYPISFTAHISLDCCFDVNTAPES